MSDIQIETLLKFYDSARQEIISRVTLRENSQMIFLGAVGALIAAAIQAQQPLFLLVIPYLSVGISLIMLHHNAVIGALIIYCASELKDEFIKRGIHILQWDNSQSRLLSSELTKKYRYWGDLGLILAPSLLSIALNIQDSLKNFITLSALLLGIVCIITSFIFLKKTSIIRNETFNKIKS